MYKKHFFTLFVWNTVVVMMDHEIVAESVPLLSVQIQEEMHGNKPI